MSLGAGGNGPAAARRAVAAVAAPVIFPGHVRKLFGTTASNPEFEARYAAGLQRLIRHLNSDAVAGSLPGS